MHLTHSLGRCPSPPLSAPLYEYILLRLLSPSSLPPSLYLLRSSPLLLYRACGATKTPRRCLHGLWSRFVQVLGTTQKAVKAGSQSTAKDASRSTPKSVAAASPPRPANDTAVGESGASDLDSVLARLEAQEAKAERQGRRRVLCVCLVSAHLLRIYFISTRALLLTPEQKIELPLEPLPVLVYP